MKTVKDNKLSSPREPFEQAVAAAAAAAAVGQKIRLREEMKSGEVIL